MIVESIHKHLSENHSEYKPYGILPINKGKTNGRSILGSILSTENRYAPFFSKDGAFSIRYMFFSPMVHELLFRQEEFGNNIRARILKASRCKHCGYYGDKQISRSQHHFFVRERLIWMCNSVWLEISNIGERNLDDNDINDLLFLIDLNSKHMAHSAKEKGAQGGAKKICCVAELSCHKSST